VQPLWPKNCTLEVAANRQKILRYWTKYAFLCIIDSLSIFFLGGIKTPWGDAHKFDIVLAYLSWMKNLVFVC